MQGLVEHRDQDHSLTFDYSLAYEDCYIPGDSDDDDGDLSSVEKGAYDEHELTEDPRLLPELFAESSQGTVENSGIVEFEETLFSTYVKLFEYVSSGSSNSWKERGVGYLKFLRRLEEGPLQGTVRLAMYRQGTLVTLLDHLMEDEMQEPKPIQGKKYAYAWHADGRTFGAQFQTNDEDIPKLWLQHFEDTKKTTALARLGCYSIVVSPSNEITYLRTGDSARNGWRHGDSDSDTLIVPHLDRPHLQKRRRLSL